MTHYRSGHWRRGRNGDYHWVSGHSVNRGSGYGVGAESYTWQRVSPWAGPNATCPVCGARVFFYRDPKTGGSAYFDRMGVPWPRHRCMDAAAPPMNPPVAGPRTVQSPTRTRPAPSAGSRTSESVPSHERQPPTPRSAPQPRPPGGVTPPSPQRPLPPSRTRPSWTARSIPDGVLRMRPWLLLAAATAAVELIGLFVLMVLLVGPETPRSEMVSFLWLWVAPCAGLGVAVAASDSTSSARCGSDSRHGPNGPRHPRT